MTARRPDAGRDELIAQAVAARERLRFWKVTVDWTRAHNGEAYLKDTGFLGYLDGAQKSMKRIEAELATAMYQRPLFEDSVDNTSSAAPGASDRTGVGEV